MYIASWVQETIASLKEKGLAKYYTVSKTAEMCLGWQYVYASQGQECTPAWRRSRIPY